MNNLGIRQQHKPVETAKCSQEQVGTLTNAQKPAEDRGIHCRYEQTGRPAYVKGGAQHFALEYTTGYVPRLGPGCTT